jgi:hypothetical protein
MSWPPAPSPLADARDRAIIGDPVTMDFLPNRLNVTYSEAGVVTDVYCG